MSLLATDLRRDLEQRFATAIADAVKSRAGWTCRRVAVEEQKRCRERMATCTLTVLGEGWMGTVTLLVPEQGAQGFAQRALGAKPHAKLRGVELAEGLGAVTAESALRFATAFRGEESATLGPPTVVMGDACAVSFPWGNHFETRLSFESEPTPFWAILRLTHVETP